MLRYIAARWKIEVLFGDGKEELGLDHLSTDERARLEQQWERPVTIGEARRQIQCRHRRRVLDWLHDQHQSGVQPDSLYDHQFAA